MLSLPFCLDLYTPLHLLPSYQTDSSVSFRPLLCILVWVYKTHWQQSMYRLCLFSPTSASPFLWTTGCVFPITQPLSFIPPPNWSLIPAPHLSEGLNKGRGHLSFSSSPPAKLAVVASIDSWKAFKAPLLCRVGGQTSCSFAAFLSFQPDSCLPSESKKETLIISPAKVTAVTTPICQLQHTCRFYPFNKGGTWKQIMRWSILILKNHFYLYLRNKLYSVGNHWF